MPRTNRALLTSVFFGLSAMTGSLLGSSVLAQSAETSSTVLSELPTAGQNLMAVRDVRTLSGQVIEAGSAVEVIAVIEVAQDIAPSGYLLNFKTKGGVSVADLASFEATSKNGPYYFGPVSSDDRGGSAEACVIVLGADGREPDLEGLSFRDYIDVAVDGEPLNIFSVRIPPQPSWRDDPHNEFCVSGLPYSQVVSITLKPGLQPNDGAARFTEELSTKITTAERTPRISVDAGKNIIPLTEQAVLPVTVVNVPELSVDVYRIDPRTISEMPRIFSAQDEDDAEDIAFTYGESLGSFPIKIPSELNVSATYNLQLDRILKETSPGLYVAIFNAEALDLGRYENRPTQWFMRSNLGLMTYSGLNETQIVISDFKTLEPVQGADVEIIAHNNRVLFSGVSQSDGTVNVPQPFLAGQGGHAPEYIFIHSEAGDFAVVEALGIKKQPAAFRGGAEKSLPEDVYLTLAREMVRAGEHLDFHAAARSLDLKPLKEFDIDAILIGPDGDDLKNSELQTNAFGMASGRFSLAPNEKLGRYSIELRRKDGVVLARTAFKVDEFVPLTIEAGLTSDQSVWQKSEPLGVTLDAAYFSGGAAAGLSGAIRYELRNTRSIDGLDGYVFGAADITTAKEKLPEREFILDENGQFQDVVVAADFSKDLSGLQELIVHADVFDAGGRPNPTRLTVPVDSAPYYIGVLPQFDEYVETGATPSFMISTFDRSGNLVPSQEVGVTVERLNYRYDWYYNSGWRWRRYLDTTALIESKKVQPGLVTLAAPLGWGRYRLSVSDTSDALTEYEFYVGWGGDGSLSTEPSELQVFVEPNSSDDLRRLRLKAPFDGQLRVQVAAEDVVSTKLINVKKGDVEVDVEVPNEREPGVNVLVTLVRPVERGTEHLPQIALGRAWVEMLSPDRKLTVDLQLPKQIRSDEQVSFSFDAKEKGSAQFFLVDEGIHALTGFQNKNPQDHFFGERASGIGFVSNFGRLLTQDDSLKAFSVGGDGWLELSRTVQKSDFFKTVFKASPIVDINRGRNTYAFDAPNMEGRLRLVALVATEGGIGFSEAKIQVQDPISLDVSLPRFVAVGDRIEGKLALRAHETARVELTYVVDGKEHITKLSLPKGQRLTKAIDFLPQKVGIIPVTIRLKTTDMNIMRSYEIVAREPSYAHYEAKSFKLDGLSRTYRVPALELDDFSIASQPTLQLRASISPVSGAGMAQVADALDRYPYGCIEQTSSATRGLIFRAKLLGTLGGEQLKKINQGITRILSMQKRDGSFGYWSSTGYVVEEYQPYAVETLLYALDYADDPEKVKSAIHKGLDYLERIRSEDLWTEAYAFGVLAKGGREVTSRARYFLDIELLKSDTLAAISKAERTERASGAYWLARLIGDTRRANQAAEELQSASSKILSDTDNFIEAAWTLPVVSNYAFRAPESLGFLLSDPALTTVPKEIATIRHATASYLAAKRYRSTFDNAKLAQIFVAEKASISGAKLTINGVPQNVSKDGMIRVSRDALASGFVMEATSHLVGYLNVEAVGKRLSSQAVENGFAVSKEIYDADGRLVYSDADECVFDHEQTCTDDIALCEWSTDANGYWRPGQLALEAKRRNLACGRFGPNSSDITIPAKHSGVGSSFSAVQGDLFSVIVRVKRKTKWASGDLMITDLLPSGFELENGELTDPMLETMSGALKPALPKKLVEPVNVQKMDDRFAAHFRVSMERQQQVVTHYVMRAVNPGLVTVPDAHAELMYQPNENGRSGMGSADVALK